jgi:hypothetical protein
MTLLDNLIERLGPVFARKYEIGHRKLPFYGSKVQGSPFWALS